MACTMRIVPFRLVCPNRYSMLNCFHIICDVSVLRTRTFIQRACSRASQNKAPTATPAARPYEMEEINRTSTYSVFVFVFLLCKYTLGLKSVGKYSNP